MITNLRQIIKVVEWINSNEDYQWWTALLEKWNDDLPRVIADYLDDIRHDYLHAEAWREIYKQGYYPYFFGNDPYWLTDGYSWPDTENMQSWDKFIADNNLRWKCIIPKELIYNLWAMENMGPKINQIIYVPEYQCVTRSCGRAWAFVSLARAIALQKAGFKPQVFDDPVAYSHARLHYKDAPVAV